MMTIPDNGQSGFGLQFVEGSLMLAGMLVAFALPRTCDRQFRALEQSFSALARRRGLSVLIVGLSVIVLRLALLPLMPPPLPFSPNDFSFLLSCDTFLHGRLTNPTPAMWRHLETIHVTMQPTYASMYFPSVGLLLALSKVIFGSAWIGILGVTALMCAAICWMLQAWVPAQWAFLGGLLAVMHLGLFSYWVNSYGGGGSLAGLGGALILGALPRILREVHFRHLLLMAIGVILVGLTRPYEGTLLCLPVAVKLGIWLVHGEGLPARRELLKMTAMPLALIVGAVCWLGYYDYRNFGSATTLPYSVDRTTYAMAPYFIWQKLRPEPQYRHASIQRFYELETRYYAPASTVGGFMKSRLLMTVGELRFFCGFALLPILIGFPAALRDRRTGFLSLVLLILLLGLIPEGYLIPHYVAPFTAALYGLAIQAMRHLRAGQRAAGSPGRSIVRVSILICAFMTVLRPFDRVLGMPVRGISSSDWNFTWYGPDHFGVERAGAEKMLAELPGRQLAIVRYAPSHWPIDQWVYNGADIDSSKVIWAQDMGADENQELIHYYKDRKVWLVQPDEFPVKVISYSRAKR